MELKNHQINFDVDTWKLLEKEREKTGRPISMLIREIVREKLKA